MSVKLILSPFKYCLNPDCHSELRKKRGSPYNLCMKCLFDNGIWIAARKCLYSTKKEREKQGRINLKKFYKRIFPRLSKEEQEFVKLKKYI